MKPQPYLARKPKTEQSVIVCYRNGNAHIRPSIEGRTFPVKHDFEDFDLKQSPDGTHWIVIPLVDEYSFAQGLISYLAFTGSLPKEAHKSDDPERYAAKMIVRSLEKNKCKLPTGCQLP